MKPESNVLGAVSHRWLGKTCLTCSMWCAKVDEIAFVELVCRSGGASPLSFFEYQPHRSGLRQETRGTYRLLLLWSNDLAARRLGACVFRTPRSRLDVHYQHRLIKTSSSGRRTPSSSCSRSIFETRSRDLATTQFYTGGTSNKHARLPLALVYEA
jgi:hypothetical protein